MIRHLLVVGLVLFSTVSFAQQSTNSSKTKGVAVNQSRQSEAKTKGVGIYPGRPSESFEPVITIQDVPAKSETAVLRNLARNRKAYHSSSYDYNLTAQLVTDGIVARNVPPHLQTIINGTPQPKREREWLIDGNEYSHSIAMRRQADIQLIWRNMCVEADSVVLKYTVAYDDKSNAGGALATNGSGAKSNEGAASTTYNCGYRCRMICDYDTLVDATKSDLPGRKLRYELQADPNKQSEQGTLSARVVEEGYRLSANRGRSNLSTAFSQLRILLQMDGAAYWDITEVKFYHEGNPVITELLPSSQFGSAWMSLEGGDQWLYVDLGAVSHIGKVHLHWLSEAPNGHIELSDDAQSWVASTPLPGQTGNLNGQSSYLNDKSGRDYELAIDGRARYVKIALNGSDVPYVLSEFEVYGTGGTYVSPSRYGGQTGNTLSLNGGDWRLQRSSEVRASGKEISMVGYPTADWVQATVPGTVLTSYTNIGAVPNANFDDDLFQISESFFYSDFWYRTTFILPPSFDGRNIFLNLDGINWKADVWVNGTKVDRVEGPFMRGRTNITPLLSTGVNVLAIKVDKVLHPGAVKEKFTLNTDFNGGVLGLDNPAFHSTIGWDWINTIRGREVGIWNDVTLTAERQLTLRNPFVGVTLNKPDTLATLSPSVEVINNGTETVKARLTGWVGDVRFSEDVTLQPGTNRVAIEPKQHPELCNQRMALWWPNGYGAPILHDAGFKLTLVGDASTSEVPESELHFKQGIREVTYRDVDTALKIYVNGRRIVPLGGNWGFSEHNLNYRAREYDTAVRYHRDMNFNMIRNWVGQTGDEEFYEACDKYGILVWQDFWLANPCDGPDPSDEKMFMLNAEDFVKRIRQHASIALYCGRNEGYPPKSLDDNLRRLVDTEHCGMTYISSSADDGVSGHGPYWAITPKSYFEKQTGKLHTERGMPNVMQHESIERTLRQEHLWPQNTFWGQHDYVMAGAQRGATFNKLVEQYGQPQSAKAFAKMAQYVNYDGYRAMFESGSAHRQGLLIWMSHACWPSMTWQCYDYYFDPTAAFFGCKKACERLHVQYNASTQKVEVVNLGVGNRDGLVCRAEVVDLQGNVLSTTTTRLLSRDDSTTEVTKVDTQKVNGPYFLRLKLTEGRNVISDNTYLLSANDDFSAINALPQAAVQVKTGVIKENKEGDERTMDVILTAPKQTPVVLTRLCLKDENGEQVLPVFYSDNFFHLMPGEKKHVTLTWRTEDQHTPKVELTVSAQNMR